MWLRVGGLDPEAIGKVLVSIRVESVSRIEVEFFTMRSNTVAEPTCRSLGGFELSRKAKVTYEGLWSVRSGYGYWTADSGQRGSGRTFPLFPLPRQDRPFTNKILCTSRSPGQRAPRPNNEADK